MVFDSVSKSNKQILHLLFKYYGVLYHFVNFIQRLMLAQVPIPLNHLYLHQIHDQCPHNHQYYPQVNHKHLHLESLLLHGPLIHLV